MEVELIDNAKVLIPNKEHQNFTETEEVIKKGTKVSGEKKEVKGKRKGEPFTYKVFVIKTEDPKMYKLIYVNKIKPINMKTVEVSLGADAAQTPTVVDMKKPEHAHKVRFYGAVGGAIAGYAYCKYKKHETKKTLKYVVGGAILGFVSGYLWDMNSDKITIKKSK